MPIVYRQQSLKDLHEKYVITTADKAGNNVVLFVRTITMKRFGTNLVHEMKQ